MPKYTTPRTLFGRRLREARLRAGIPQDKLGVLIGIDELSSSARISRYENGTHEPPFAIAEKLASVLRVPPPFFYSPDDELAHVIRAFAAIPPAKRVAVIALLHELSNEAD